MMNKTNCVYLVEGVLYYENKSEKNNSNLLCTFGNVCDSQLGNSDRQFKTELSEIDLMVPMLSVTQRHIQAMYLFFEYYLIACFCILYLTMLIIIPYNKVHHIGLIKFLSYYITANLLSVSGIHSVIHARCCSNRIDISLLIVVTTVHVQIT